MPNGGCEHIAVPIRLYLNSLLNPVMTQLHSPEKLPTWAAHARHLQQVKRRIDQYRAKKVDSSDSEEHITLIHQRKLTAPLDPLLCVRQKQFEAEVLNSGTTSYMHRLTRQSAFAVSVGPVRVSKKLTPIDVFACVRSRTT